jgi:hypothetical protein
MLTPLLAHVCFFHFNDTCSLNSNGSTKFLESLLSLILFQKADLALLLECYVVTGMFPKEFTSKSASQNIYFLTYHVVSPKPERQKPHTHYFSDV